MSDSAIKMSDVVRIKPGEFLGTFGELFIRQIYTKEYEQGKDYLLN